MTKHDYSAIIDQVKDIKRISDEMNDPEVDKALALVIETIKKPDVSAHAHLAVTQLSALAAYFAVEATYYKNWGKAGIEERFKKDMYYTLNDALSQLADAIKYQAKQGAPKFNP